MLNDLDDFFIALNPEAALWTRYYYYPSLNEEAEARRCEINGRGLHSEWKAELEFRFRADSRAPPLVWRITALTLVFFLCHCQATGLCKSPIRSRLRDRFENGHALCMCKISRLTLFVTPNCPGHTTSDESGGFRYALWGLLGVIKCWEDTGAGNEVPAEFTRENLSLALTSPPGVNSLAQHLIFSRVRITCGLKTDLLRPVPWTPYTWIFGSNV